MFTAALEHVSRGALSRPRAVLLVAALVIAGAAYGTTQVRVDNNSISYLEKGSQVVKASLWNLNLASFGITAKRR